MAVVVREFVWGPDKDDGWPGTGEKQNDTDQQCSGCGRWFTPEGIGAHEENCDFEEYPMMEWDEEKERILQEFCRHCDAWLPIGASPSEHPRRHEDSCRFSEAD